MGGDPVFRIGGSPVSLTGVATGLAVFVVAWFLSRLVGRSLSRLRERSGRAAGPLYVLEKVAGYGLVVFGVFAGLSAAGLNCVAGGIRRCHRMGVGLAQGVVKEFVSARLIFDRMVSVGDYVRLGSRAAGPIGAGDRRPTRHHLCTNDNVNILVPNSRLIEGRVPMDAEGDTRRITSLLVAYGAERRCARRGARRRPAARPYPPETETRKSQVCCRFRRSGLDFELLVWPTREAGQAPFAARRLHLALADAADEAGSRSLPPDRPSPPHVSWARGRGRAGHPGPATRHAVAQLIPPAPGPRRQARAQAPRRSRRRRGMITAPDPLGRRRVGDCATAYGLTHPTGTRGRRPRYCQAGPPHLAPRPYETPTMDNLRGSFCAHAPVRALLRGGRDPRRPRAG